MNILFGNDYMPAMVASLQAELPDHDVRGAPEDAVIEAVSDIHVILPSRAIISAEVMDAAPRLRLIQQAGIGTDMVDKAAAREREIPVANVPAPIGGLGKAVAETALFLMIGAGRNMAALNRALASQDWNLPIGYSVFDARVCIVGVGGIGGQLARMLRVFDCDVVGVKRTPDPGLQQELGLTELFTSDRLVEAVRGCRFLVVAAPLDESTIGLINTEVLEALPQDAAVINIARGKLIDKAALMAALKSGHLSAAGLDVFWEEPADLNDPLFELEIFATPHCAAFVDLYIRDTAAGVAANVRRLERGEPLEWRVDLP